MMMMMVVVLVMVAMMMTFEMVLVIKSRTMVVLIEASCQAGQLFGFRPN